MCTVQELFKCGVYFVQLELEDQYGNNLRQGEFKYVSSHYGFTLSKLVYDLKSCKGSVHTFLSSLSIKIHLILKYRHLVSSQCRQDMVKSNVLDNDHECY